MSWADNKTEICPECGTREALDAAGVDKAEQDKIIAEIQKAAAGAGLYEIKPAVPYERRDLNWMDKKARSTVEMQDLNCRPALADAAPLRWRGLTLSVGLRYDASISGAYLL